MSVVGDFTIPAEAFALEHALTAVPEITVEADRLGSHSPNEVFPFLWATRGDFERLYRALQNDETVTNVDIAERTDREVLYRLKWCDSFCDLIHEIVDHHAAIVDASAHGAQWDLRLRFAEEAMVSSFQRHFRNSGHQFDVHQLYYPTEPRQRTFGLTAEQYEALVTAVDEGYFSVPRVATTEEVSDSLGISANAISERIRRGCDKLIRSGLTVRDDAE